jgi:hypothetical protein
MPNASSSIFGVTAFTTALTTTANIILRNITKPTAHSTFRILFHVNETSFFVHQLSDPFTFTPVDPSIQL